MLIDRFLPRWDVIERHDMVVRADAAAVWRALLDLDLSRSGLIRVLFFVRGLGRGPHTLDRMIGIGFTELARDEGREIVLGLVGRPWRLRADLRREDDFEAFDEPGFVKIAWNFFIDGEEGGCRVSTETRVLATDEAAKVRFKRYWAFVGRFSGLVRLEALGIIKRAAERDG